MWCAKQAIRNIQIDLAMQDLHVPSACKTPPVYADAHHGDRRENLLRPDAKPFYLYWQPYLWFCCVAFAKRTSFTEDSMLGPPAQLLPPTYPTCVPTVLAACRHTSSPYYTKLPTPGTLIEPSRLGFFNAFLQLLWGWCWAASLHAWAFVASRAAECGVGLDP